MVLKRYLPELLIAALATWIAWAFAATVLAHTERMGLPLDDSYIYLTYAKQFGRGQPFTYFPGGGYSAGSTSVLWPMLIAPFWTLGARGHALVWVAFGLGGALYAATAIGCYRFARQLGGTWLGVLAGVMALAAAPFAFASFAAMEVSFASALLVATLLLLARAPKTGAPPRPLALCLGALSLSRPEATLIAIALCAACAADRARRREWRAAAWWLAPLAAPAAWLAANKLFAGHLFPNTGVAKSHFYLPGFDWTYWWHAVGQQTGAALRGLFWDAKSPLVWPRAVALAYVIGAVRIVWWARREQRWLAGVLAVGAPLALIASVIAASGQWNFQNYRYIAAALPFVLLVAACALAPLRDVENRPPVWRRVHEAWLAAATIVVALFVRAAIPHLASNMRLFAQGAMDTNSQVVHIGQYLHDRLPDARVMFHDAGAIAYYGDTYVYDMLGLVTNHQTEVANNGPGARFEFLESLPPEQRPTHFAYYPGWMGTTDFFGDSIVHTTLFPQFEPGRLVGESDMQVIVASWDHVGTGERPLNDHAGWAIVDRVDIADIASEHAHRWRGRLGRRHFGDPTARWSVVEREVGDAGLVIDGGRTIRDGGETFTVSLDPAKPTRVLLRSGGAREYGWNEPLTKPVELHLWSGTRDLGKLVLAPPSGTFQEIAFNLPPHTFHARDVELRVEATGMYRVFHWFVLQPE
ncbi:MAG: hypothetical protein ACM31C_22400 [Acidobacteriota bacterium]